MKEIRIQGRTIVRIIYAIIGGLLIAQSIYMQEWIGILPGGYIALMGLLGFGCAGGGCMSGKCDVPRR